MMYSSFASTDTDMCIAAMRDLGETKAGWSLKTIRKKILTLFPDTIEKQVRAAATAHIDTFIQLVTCM